MTTGEYILALMAIISGLAITHLVGATSMLIEHRQKVAWDWLAVSAGAYLAYVVIYGWWISFTAFHAETGQLSFYRFLLPTLNVIFLALAARAVLPDKVPDEGLDLAAHYARNSRFIFLCLLVCQLISVWGTAIRWRTSQDVTAALPGGSVPFFASIAAVATLAAVGRRAVHAFLLPVLFAALVIGSITRVV